MNNVWCNGVRSCLGAFVLLVLSLGTQSVYCAVVTITIGDDDGFGATQGIDSNPGDAFTSFSSPAIAPSATPYSDASGLDATTSGTFTPYVFEFTFDWDASSLGTIAQAVVTVQSGSVARRNGGGGFGLAQVTADVLQLGDFLTSGTGAAGSAAEENVKAHGFDVTGLIVPVSNGSFVFTIDGSSLANPIDRFALDFVELSIEGTPVLVPLPATLALLGPALIALVGMRSRRSKKLP